MLKHFSNPQGELFSGLVEMAKKGIPDEACMSAKSYETCAELQHKAILGHLRANRHLNYESGHPSNVLTSTLLPNLIIVIALDF